MSHKPSLPAWQRAQAPPSSPESDTAPASQPESESQAAVGAEESAREEPRKEKDQEGETQSSSLLQQASRFLEDPEIRDAPRDKKATFLASKGVESRDIDTLLDSQIPLDAAPDITEAGERAWSTASPQTSQTQPSISSPSPASNPQPRAQPREVPPIVTYPEFLTQSTKPPPLITTQRLLNTAYVTGGLAATMYGLSSYIIQPMTERLTEARHEFSSHAQEQIEDLNKRLEDAVSVDPATKAKPKPSEVMDDLSDAESDPTELFHRDYGTQTTPTLSRRPSVASNPEDKEPVVSSHENRLKILTSHLKELEDTHATDAKSSDSLKSQVSDLTTYLNEMSYQNQYYSGMGGFYGSNYGRPKGKDGKDDQIEVLKSDIRAVKGVFLSARNFPAGGSNTPPLAKAGG